MSDTYDYYRNLIDAALAAADEDERSLIVASGISELVERDEVEAVSRDIAGSRVIQKLIELAPPDGAVVGALAEQFAKNWFALATDRFASYVLEDYLKRLASIPTSKLQANADMDKFFKTVCKVTRLNIDECLPHARSSHVIRGLICALAAVHCFPKGVGDDAVRLLSPGISLKSRKRLVTLACAMTSSKAISQPALLARLCNEYAAPVYCTLLKVAKFRFPEEFRLEFCKLLAKCVRSGRPDSAGVCCDAVLSHVVNDLIQAVPPQSSLFDKLMKRYLGLGKDDAEERIKELAVDPVGNYCVQTALKVVRNADEFEVFSKAILSSMTAIFNAGCLGVVTQMVRAAVRLLSPASGIPPLAKHLHSEIARVLSCNEDDRSSMIVPCLFYYLPFSNLPESFETGPGDEPLPAPNLPGCLLLEALFTLPNPSAYVSSLTSANKGFLSAAASTAEGYHVLSQVFAAKNVSASAKTEVVACLAPKEPGASALPLATTHFGCLTYKAMWDSLPRERHVIASYLSNFPEALRETKFGRFLYAAFALRLYSQNPGRWASIKTVTEKDAGSNQFSNKKTGKGNKRQHDGAGGRRFQKRNTKS